jgi:hypothetical protein
MTRIEKYNARVVMANIDGEISISEMFRMLVEPSYELMEYYSLAADLSIFENSPEARRLKQLGKKYDTQAIARVSIW